MLNVEPKNFNEEFLVACSDSIRTCDASSVTGVGLTSVGAAIGVYSFTGKGWQAASAFLVSLGLGLMYTQPRIAQAVGSLGSCSTNPSRPDCEKCPHIKKPEPENKPG